MRPGDQVTARGARERSPGQQRLVDGAEILGWFRGVSWRRWRVRGFSGSGYESRGGENLLIGWGGISGGVRGEEEVSYALAEWKGKRMGKVMARDMPESLK